MNTYQKQTEKSLPIKIRESTHSRFKDFVKNKHGQAYGYMLEHADEAINEYLDREENKTGDTGE